MIDVLTPRLRLRPWTEDDAQFVLELHQNPDLVRFIPSSVLHDLAGARERIARFGGYAQDPALGFPCVQLRDGPPVGLVMVKPIPPSGRGPDAPDEPGPGQRWDIEIGWRQHAAHTGHGYVTEAAGAVLANCFAQGLTRVVAVTHPDNAASQRVAERIGMRRVGLTRDYYDAECVLFEALAPGAPPAA